MQAVSCKATFSRPAARTARVSARPNLQAFRRPQQRQGGALRPPAAPSLAHLEPRCQEAAAQPSAPSTTAKA